MGEIQAGPELDRLASERVFGISLTPPREYAMAKVGMARIAWSGPGPWGIRLDNETIEMLLPPGDSLPQPEGSSYWNDRYGLYIAQQLGDRVAAEVDAYRLDPEPYSTDLNAAGLVLERLRERGYTIQIVWRPEDAPEIRAGTAMHFVFRTAPTLPEAICRAALALAERERGSGKGASDDYGDGRG